MNLPSFDVLRALFQSDPVAFEKLRRELIESEICKVPMERQRRLRGLQFQIDAIRQTSKTPLACCVVIQQMLHHKAFELLTILREGQLPSSRPPYQNNVLSFPHEYGRAMANDAPHPSDN